MLSHRTAPQCLRASNRSSGRRRSATPSGHATHAVRIPWLQVRAGGRRRGAMGLTGRRRRGRSRAGGAHACERASALQGHRLGRSRERSLWCSVAARAINPRRRSHRGPVPSRALASKRAAAPLHRRRPSRHRAADQDPAGAQLPRVQLGLSDIPVLSGAELTHAAGFAEPAQLRRTVRLRLTCPALPWPPVAASRRSRVVAASAARADD